MMRKLASFMVCVALMAGPVVAGQGPEDVAQQAAEMWLQLVDSQQYGESWQQAAEIFRGAVTKEQWQQAVTGARKPLGKLVSRKLKLREYTEQMPGAPDGKYVVIQFEAVFENKAAAVETITPMLDPDGKWRVSGYLIR